MDTKPNRRNGYASMQPIMALGATLIALLVGAGMLFATPPAAEAAGLTVQPTPHAASAVESTEELAAYYRYAWGVSPAIAWHAAKRLEAAGYRIVSPVYWGRVPEAPGGWAYRVDVVWPG